ncbi:MAG: glycosyltransferase family 9 protein [Candidatus Xenobia bacterium]
MKVTIMRKIDYWAGIPLCFLVSCWRKLWPDRGRELKNVLFIELSEMGSAILVDPAMQKLLRDRPQVSLFFVIFESCKDSLRFLGTVPAERVFSIRDKNFTSLAVDSLKFLAWCRKQGIDTVIDLELFSRFTALLSGLCGATRRVGFHAFRHEGLYRGDIMTHRVAYNPHQHITRNFLSLIHALLSAQPQVPFSKVVIDAADLKLNKATIRADQRAEVWSLIAQASPRVDPQQHRLLLVNPNASDMLPQRRWMRENFVELIRMILADQEDVYVLLTGATPERVAAESMREAVGSERCLNLAGQLGLLQLLPLYDISEIMVTNDSGPAHFAAVTRMPTVVLFGPETPSLYGSLGDTIPIYAGLACSPCVAATNHRDTACRDNVCLQVIKPAQVYAAVQYRLSAGRQGTRD